MLAFNDEEQVGKSHDFQKNKGDDKSGDFQTRENENKPCGFHKREHEARAEVVEKYVGGSWPDFKQLQVCLERNSLSHVCTHSTFKANLGPGCVDLSSKKFMPYGIEKGDVVDELQVDPKVDPKVEPKVETKVEPKFDHIGLVPLNPPTVPCARRGQKAGAKEIQAQKHDEKKKKNNSKVVTKKKPAGLSQIGSLALPEQDVDFEQKKIVGSVCLSQAGSSSSLKQYGSSSLSEKINMHLEDANLSHADSSSKRSGLRPRKRPSMVLSHSVSSGMPLKKRQKVVACKQLTAAQKEEAHKLHSKAYHHARVAAMKAGKAPCKGFAREVAAEAKAEFVASLTT